MPSLKEVKTRIVSVQSTRKITSAMKMVASSKLHKAQQAIESMRPYERQLSHIMTAFVSGLHGDVTTPLATVRQPGHVVLVAVSSNSSLCGGFNANVIRKLRQTLDEYRQTGVEVSVIPIGRKVAEAVRRLGLTVDTDRASLLDHPSYAEAAALVRGLMQQFSEGSIDRVELIYHHFKSTSRQILQRETLLPVTVDEDGQEGLSQGQSVASTDYIVEPSAAEVLKRLVPQTLCLKLYAALLDSLASEHAARVVAMQVATDNADELLRDLTLQYNKSRQQAITSELLDIAGGSLQ